MDQPLKIIDSILFKIVDDIKTHPIYQKIIEQIASLDEEYRQIVNQALSTCLMLMPVVFMIFGTIKINKLNSEKELKMEILSLTQNIINQGKDIKQNSKSILNITPISSKSAMENKIEETSSSKGINAKKIIISEFSSDKSSSVITTNAKLLFKAFTLKELVELIKGLTISQKMKISSIEVNKNNRTVSGTLGIIHFATPPDGNP